MAVAALLTLLAGCAQPPAKDISVEKPQPAIALPVPAEAQMTALNDENETRYLEAHRYWLQAAATVDGKIAEIEKQMRVFADVYAMTGVAYYEAREGTKALREFFEALKYDPANNVALDYLKNRYQIGRYILCPVREGDTFASIADRVYGSPDLAPIIAHFSKAGRQEDLTPGSMLMIAVLNSFESNVLKDYRKNIRIARESFKAKDLEASLAAAHVILQNHPTDTEASYIENMSLLGLAEKQEAAGNFDGAAASLSDIDPSFINLKKLITELRERQKDYSENKVERDNRQLLDEGERLYAKGEYLAALKTFLLIDSDYEGVTGAIERTKEQLGNEAEAHFKEGIKLFVDEDLNGAIREWEEVLKRDPNHHNAIDSIAKARRLLEKVKAIR